MKLAVTDKLSTLWLVVMLNMIVADVLSAFVAFTDSGVLGLPDNAKSMMAVFALVINLPIAMIYFSRVLPRKQNRVANIAIAIITIMFVIGGGSSLPHYYVIGAIEVLVLLAIISIAWRWPAEARAQ